MIKEEIIEIKYCDYKGCHTSNEFMNFVRDFKEDNENKHYCERHLKKITQQKCKHKNWMVSSLGSNFKTKKMFFLQLCPTCKLEFKRFQVSFEDIEKCGKEIKFDEI